MQFKKLEAIRQQITLLQKNITEEVFDYKPLVDDWIEKLKDFPQHQEMLRSVKSVSDLRFLMRYNLFLFLTCLCHKNHLLNQWAADRCKEVQAAPNGYLDLWAREHYKSTIITFGKSIQEICITHGNKDSDINEDLIVKVYNWMAGHSYSLASFALAEMKKRICQDDLKEEITIGILSCTRTLAQSFLWEIKKELEQNVDLQALYPDIFYKNPDSLSDKWSVQAGINVKRKSVRKEATVEAWGLITGQPTGKHFGLCVYDDIITHDIVKTIYLSKVATDSWENSLSLGSQNGIRRYVGTRKHYSDTYSVIIERSAARLRRYTPYKDNNEANGLALFSEQELQSRRKSMGEATYAAEYLQEPLKSSALSLNVDNLQYHAITNYDNLNLYFFVDPATSQKSTSDYFALLVIGVDKSGALIIIDGIRDRLKLAQRWNAVYQMYAYYPQVKKIFYEKAGMNSDIDYFTIKANEIGNVGILSLINPITPTDSKKNRIMQIDGLLNDKKIFLLKSLLKKAVNGSQYDLIRCLVIEEMQRYPFPSHDDLLDCLAYATIFLMNNQLDKPSFNDESLEDFYKSRQITVGGFNEF